MSAGNLLALEDIHIFKSIYMIEGDSLKIIRLLHEKMDIVKHLH